MPDKSSVAGVTYDNMDEKIVEAFPGMRARYDEQKSWWKGEKPGQHVIFGDVVYDYVEKLIRDEKAGELSRLLNYLEMLAKHPNPRVQDPILTTVAENICTDDSVWTACRNLLGPIMRKYCDKYKSA